MIPSSRSPSSPCTASRPAPWLRCLAFGLLLSGFPMSARAVEPPEPKTYPPTTHPDVPDDFDGYSALWTGAFFGPTVFGGPTWAGNDAFDATGWTVGAGLRVCSVASLVDFQVEYHFTQLDGAWRGVALQTDHHVAGLVVSIHPFFLTNLGGNRFWYTVAATVLQAGLSVDHLSVGFDGAEDGETGLGLFGGVELDTPITDPDAGGALWLGAGYRVHFVGVEARPFGGDALWEHLLNLHLSYRHNGLPF